MEELRYPIGRFKPPRDANPETRRQWTEAIESAPAQLRAAVSGLSDQQLDTPYRPRGWTLRQVVHHVADSHLNSYIRMKLALTEQNPEIGTYQQDRWAELSDSRSGDLELSLPLLEALHRRWTAVLRSFGPATWAQSFRHPELGQVSLDMSTALYAWPGTHHTAHIMSLRERRGW